MKLKRIVSIVLVFALAMALAVPAAAGDIPRAEGPDWLRTQGLRLRHNFTGTILFGRRETSFLVAHDGAIVHEQYARGFDAATIHPMNSATKSFVAAMIGVAMRDGYIDCLSQKAVEFFPEATILPGHQARKRDVTIAQLMTMTAGFPWFAQRQSMDFMLCETDSGLAAFEVPLALPPGMMWAYCGGAGMQVLVSIIERASGRDFYEYIRAELFGPLGMTSAYWNVFTADGRVKGGGGLYMNVEDMLRFGQLYMQGGLWNGRRILNEAFVNETWAEGELAAFGFMEYNLLWWANFGSRRFGPSARAQGFAGMLISVYRETDVIVVRTGEGLLGNGEGARPLILDDDRFLTLFPLGGVEVVVR
jgi:hypothetical protein